MDEVVVYLVPLGAGRFELYSEHADDSPPAARADTFVGRRLRRLSAWWSDAVERGSNGSNHEAGWFARWRDRFICRTAELIAEQRTVWALRRASAATLVYPADMTEDRARAARDCILTTTSRRHTRWLIIDAIVFVASGALALVPGPNVIAYYFGLRVVVHYLSWRGARQGLDRTIWSARAEPALAELGRLVDVPHHARASHVEAIATDLNLPRLAAFFERAAVAAR